MMKYATSFQTGQDQGKPVIFWEQQALSGQKTKKKFSYKQKEQKHGLRKAVSEPNPPPTTKDPTRQTGPRKTVIKPGQKPAPPGGKQAVQKTAPGKPAPRRGAPAAAEKPVSDGMITLTQTQLNKILDTIGELTVENVDLKDKLEVPSVSAPTASQPEHVPISQPALAEPAITESQTIPGLSDTALVSKGNVPDASPYASSQPAPQVFNQPSAQSQPEATKAEPVNSQPSPRAAPVKHLTAAEKKRLQWEREKAEDNTVKEWSPWGRPGAGAPLKDNQGNILADYTNRKDQADNKHKVSESTHQNNDVMIKQAYQPSPPQQTLPTIHTQPAAVTNANNTQGFPQSSAAIPQQYAPPAPVLGTETSSAKPPPPPAAIRSSFTVGVTAPNEDRYASGKERERQLWLADLERQREDQRQRKLHEKQTDPALHDTWADRFKTDVTPKRLPPQYAPPPQQPADDSALVTGTQPVDAGQQANRANSAPVAVPQGSTTPTPSTFIRGQNVMLDQQTLIEMEEKRRKNKEYQDYVRAQAEERDKTKQQERQRKLAEELAEEQRLAKERDNMQNQFTFEQQRQKQKEEEQMRRVETLKLAMDRAHEEAERAKHQQRMRHLQQGGHDVTNLNTKFESMMTPRDTAQPPSYSNVGAAQPSLQGHMPSGMPQEPTPRAVNVQPAHIPGLEITPRQEPSEAPPPYRDPAQLMHNIHNPYSVQQQHHVSQPDNTSVLEDEANIMYDGPLEDKPSRSRHVSKTEKKVRIVSAPKEDKPSMKKKRLGIHERPRWGQSKVKAKNVKQSERDPFYEEKKRQSDIAKAKRQQQMKAMVDHNMPMIPQVETVSSRTRSRSNERGQGSVKVTSHGDGSRHPVGSVAAQRLGRTRTRSPVAATEGRQSRPHVSPAPAARPAAVPAMELVNQTSAHSSPRRYSPPVPAIKSRIDKYVQDSARSSLGPGTKYADDNPIQAPVLTGDFVPFIRSSNVLEPGQAEDPLPISREASVVQRARKAYLQEKQPGKYGTMMENIEDTSTQLTKKQAKDPILNPDLIHDHPTSRQGRILQQLSDLRKGLRQKQKELEMGYQPFESVSPTGKA